MENQHDILILGGGSGGIALASSLLARDSSLQISLVEPAQTHYYQPAWTLVGAGQFAVADTARPMQEVMPKGVNWIRASVVAFDPEKNQVTLDNGEQHTYKNLVVALGIQLDWNAVEGLEETLGKNGVTSNYRYDLAPYTFELVQKTKKGRAIFTQPPMPIKCAGAPQKAMYLSCSNWERAGVLPDIEVEMYNAAGVLFGVAHYVPALMEYVKRYNAQLNFNASLFKIDGPAKTAWFKVKDKDDNTHEVERSFDMIHVVPPQSAPNVIKTSALANAAGWVEVDQATLQHVRFPNIFSVGDCHSAPNAKTAAAVRKQVVVVAENMLASRAGRPLPTHYDGYGACPLTVEIGKIVMAEFGFGGKLLPTFPLEGAVPRRSSWILKKNILPWVYWDAMLKGREWLARPCSK